LAPFSWGLRPRLYDVAPSGLDFVGCCAAYGTGSQVGLRSGLWLLWRNQHGVSPEDPAAGFPPSIDEMCITVWAHAPRYALTPPPGASLSGANPPWPDLASCRTLLGNDASTYEEESR
jgi:hypothetical protein